MGANLIVNTKLIKVEDTGREFRVLIALSDGGLIEHNPFPLGQEGLCAALMLAADVNAGKFWPKRYLNTSKETEKARALEDRRRLT